MQASLYIIFILCITVIILLFLLAAKDNHKHEISGVKINDALLSGEELESYARKLAFDEAARKRSNSSVRPLSRLNDNYKYILSVYKSLNDDMRRMRPILPSAEWLLDNFYIIEEQVKSIQRDLTRELYNKLPILKSGPFKGYARIYAVAMELVGHTDGKIDENVITSYINAYQTHNTLTSVEFWAMPIMIKMAVIEKIRYICGNISETRQQHSKVDEMLDRIMKEENFDAEKLSHAILTEMRSTFEIKPSFIEHLAYRLRRLGRASSQALRFVDDKLAKHGMSIDAVTLKEHNIQAVNKVSIENCILSLKFISGLNWIDVFESLSTLEQILRKDPDGTYARIDLSSRNMYRNKIEELSNLFNVSEIHIAREAVALAKKAVAEHPENPHLHNIGYYILDDGLELLEERMNYKPTGYKKLLRFAKKHPTLIYITSILALTALLSLAAVIAAAYLAGSDYSILHRTIISLLVFITLFIPSSDIAVCFVNNLLSHIIKPAILPKLDYAKSIPHEDSTIIVVPALLTDEKRAVELVKNLEVHYLANKHKNLYFALAGDFKDSDKEKNENDSAIVAAAMNAVNELNRKYPNEGSPIFYYFHRHRLYNEKHKKWMGWERKRGALIEFNEMLLGSSKTSYSIHSCELSQIPPVKYVITLDADTILPIDAAHKLIGTMSHPLNRPVIDERKNIVVKGYGLLQPRIGIDLESANKTVFSSVFAGDYGIDPYSNAVSDIYQDLFGEGIYTGKGIYDLRVFEKVMKERLPDNAILSHDLLEGSYVRTGLVTDIELVDSYPAKFMSYMARMHRWTRGDWQLIPWIFRHVRNRAGKRVINPLSGISKWKIIDNLRRSLVSPFLMLTIGAGFCIFPGHALFWTCLAALIIAFPLIVNTIGLLSLKGLNRTRIKYYLPVMSGFKAAAFRILLLFIFLPYQAYIMIHAIGVSLVRILFTRKNMLEWITASDVEKNIKNGYSATMYKMISVFIQSLAIVFLSALFKKESIPLSMLLLVIWSLSPFVSYYISKDRAEKAMVLSPKDLQELRITARKTWRYFEEFTNHKNNYLPPDNFQEDPPNGVAHRTSPTNIGLGLMAILSARDFGYIGTTEMINMLSNTISTIEKMEKWNGHLYNWYDTRNLKLLRPRYISTVDSGNLLCYLLTISEGLQNYLEKPIQDIALLKGLKDTAILANKESNNDNLFDIDMLDDFISAGNIDISDWYKLVDSFVPENLELHGKLPWLTKTQHMVHMHKRDLSAFFEWMPLVQNLSLVKLDSDISITGNSAIEISTYIKSIRDKLLTDIPLNKLSEIYTDSVKLINDTVKLLDKDCALHKSLGAIKNSLEKCTINVNNLIKKYTSLIDRISAIADGIEFKHLYNEKRQLFSIGFNIEENKLTNSYYDLLASEARQASFIAVARGEVEKDHWFKMGRTLTTLDNYKGLVSWSGTMFEYLMPFLIMKSYKNSLLDETHMFAVRSQMKYGAQRNVPWGTSESGFYLLDINLDYQYKAFGIPWLGLKRGLVEDMVVAPYATFLALPLVPEKAMSNLKKLSSVGAEGAYGYYEAIDYTPERLPFGSTNAIVKSYMVHHQGMSLISINNYLNNNVMQNRFHSVPVVKAAQLLLQEKVPGNVIFTKENKEKVTPFKQKTHKAEDAIRTYKAPDIKLPKVHLLSNGSYSIMLTDKGTGYSKNKSLQVTRWREDISLDNHGMFFYIRNADNGQVWSATYAPFNILPDNYNVTFTSDKARYQRTDGSIETRTEIIAAPSDNAEIRKLSLTNKGDHAHILEVTSYFEVVLANQNADIAHPAFSNLFIRTEFVPELNSLIASRKPRSDKEKEQWLANTIIADSEISGSIQYETDRLQFIGRGRNTSNPAAIELNKPLSNTTGPVLDPVMCLRIMIKVEPGQTVNVAYITSVAESRDGIIELAQKYNNYESVENGFRLALTRSRVESGYLNLKPSEIRLYQEMISHIVFFSPLCRQKSECILQNRKGQSSLWKYGISGDLPIVLLLLEKTDEIDIVYEILNAHEYWKIRGLTIDLVIIDNEEGGYTYPLNTLLKDVISSSHVHDMINKPGGVFILNGNNMPEDDKNLICAVSSIVLKGNEGYLSEQVAFKDEAPVYEYVKNNNTQIVYNNPHLKLPELNFFNGLGGFNEDGSEYVIYLDKDQTTPLPWINVISNKNFGFLVTESGGGYTWFENSRENKLSPWSNDPVCDTPGEILYITDKESREHWNITPLPIREDEPYIVRHGFGYTVFQHNSHGIEHELIQFVPENEPVKISIVRIKNASDKTRNIALTYYVRPVLGISDQYTSRHITTEVSSEGILIARNSYNDEFPECMAFLDAGKSERCTTADRQLFFGKGSLSNPDALNYNKLPGIHGAGFDPCMAMQVEVQLKSGETNEITFMFGMSRDIKEISQLSSKYRDTKNAYIALENVKTFWKNTVSTVKSHTPDMAFNFMLNGWLIYQVISCRIWARSAFYQSGGAYGFRDQLQDSLAIVHILPELTKQQILKHSSHQFPEGDVQHWWHEQQYKGTRTRFSDDRLWLPYAVAEYIAATGDYSILDIETPFIEGNLLEEDEDERYDKPVVSHVSASVYEHCIRAIEISLKFGEHGIPLMGSGDWNDGMNTVGNKGKGESIWLGWFLYSTLNKFKNICLKKGDIQRAEHYEESARQISEAIDKNAWDGSWYRRAYFDNGTPLGSIENSECKIDSISQSWSVISGAGKPERIAAAMNSLENYLIDKDEGLIKLLTPPFENSELEPGYIKGYVPGVRENGGQYTHASAWAILAFALMGEGDKAWYLFEMINPINHSRTHIEYSKYKVEPYVMAADIYAVHPHTGRGGWTWYTGSAGWVYKVGLENILGFKKLGNTLKIDPCIPRKWDEFKINYKYMNTMYEITVKNPHSVNRGVAKTILDGRLLEDNIIPLTDDSKKHNVEIIMGK